MWQELFKAGPGEPGGWAPAEVDFLSLHEALEIRVGFSVSSSKNALCHQNLERDLISEHAFTPQLHCFGRVRYSDYSLSLFNMLE